MEYCDIACLVVRHISTWMTTVDWVLACSANQDEDALNSSFSLPDSLQTWDGIGFWWVKCG